MIEFAVKTENKLICLSLHICTRKLTKKEWKVGEFGKAVNGHQLSVCRYVQCESKK